MRNTAGSEILGSTQHLVRVPECFNVPYLPQLGSPPTPQVHDPSLSSSLCLHFFPKILWRSTGFISAVAMSLLGNVSTWFWLLWTDLAVWPGLCLTIAGLNSDLQTNFLAYLKLVSPPWICLVISILGWTRLLSLGLPCWATVRWPLVDETTALLGRLLPLASWLLGTLQHLLFPIKKVNACG